VNASEFNRKNPILRFFAWAGLLHNPEEGLRRPGKETKRKKPSGNLEGDRAGDRLAYETTPKGSEAQVREWNLLDLTSDGRPKYLTVADVRELERRGITNLVRAVVLKSRWADKKSADQVEAEFRVGGKTKRGYSARTVDDFFAAYNTVWSDEEDADRLSPYLGPEVAEAKTNL
jgi:hypothetical protein